MGEPADRSVIRTVFISSTAEDLEEHRAAARAAALDAELFPIMMEHFAASGARPPLAACLAKVAEADVVVAVVGHRYGWEPPGQPAGEKRSVTWLECAHAVDIGKEVLGQRGAPVL